MGEGGLKNAFAIVALTLAVVACGEETGGEAVSDDSVDTASEYVIDSDTGEESMTITTPDGEVAMRSGSAVPIDLPAGFSVMDDARIISNTVVDQTDGKGAIVAFETTQNLEDVIAFYRDQAEAAGVNLEVDMTVNESRVLAGESASDLTFSLNANPIAEGTRVQLVVGQGEDY